jgi:hypothetical protein
MGSSTAAHQVFGQAEPSTIVRNDSTAYCVPTSPFNGELADDEVVINTQKNREVCICGLIALGCFFVTCSVQGRVWVNAHLRKVCSADPVRMSETHASDSHGG